MDVVNFNTKKLSVSDANGNFSICVKANDELILLSKEYIDKKITVTQSDIDTINLIVHLTKKPIELEEVQIENNSLKIKFDQAAFDKIKLEKQQSMPKNQFVYTGTIENGMDFIRMGKGLYNLFKRKTPKPKPVPKIEFADYLTNNFNEDFYLNTLHLKKDEIALFIEFCKADAKSKTIHYNDNYLTVMDFLMIKNEEFKKLK